MRFWPFAPIAAVLLGAASFLATRSWMVALVAALLWAPSAGFFYAGLRILVAQRGRGGYGWWGLALALTVASVVAAVF